MERHEPRFSSRRREKISCYHKFSRVWIYVLINKEQTTFFREFKCEWQQLSLATVKLKDNTLWRKYFRDSDVIIFTCFFEQKQHRMVSRCLLPKQSPLSFFRFVDEKQKNFHTPECTMQEFLVRMCKFPTTVVDLSAFHWSSFVIPLGRTCFKAFSFSTFIDDFFLAWFLFQSSLGKQTHCCNISKWKV